MSTADLIALFGLAVAAAWTPGPNNLMLAASGVNFGLRRTVPHICGVAFGFPVMIFAVAVGVAGVFAASEIAREALRWVGAAVLLWFAWRIATAGRAKAGDRSRPLSFIEAAGFQWINPKGWAMALATTAQFVTGENPVLEGAACAAAYMIAGLGSSIVWAAFGVGLRRFLSTDFRLHLFNGVMGLSLAAFALYLFLA